MSTPTAAIICIGNEILNGSVAEQNVHFLLKELHALGVRVKHVSVIEDDVAAVSAAVKHGQQYTHVLTTGGVGPTVDDVTMEGISGAFGVRLESINLVSD
mmetsp:Transcript_323/g.629  ORF Transcript_323/g.629 Transcript_323/m.629 type:complete len:100 (-) Transcript_323:206-505(-)